MIYYTIYVKNLQNGSGYIDIALADDQLMKDFTQYLDVNIKSNRTYAMTAPPDSQGKPVVSQGTFAINLSDVSAISVLRPDSKPAVLPPSTHHPTI
jgi:hypothetical protein